MVFRSFWIKCFVLSIAIVYSGSGSRDSAVFRKETNTDIYLHWDSFAPRTWIIGTLKLLVSRAIMISSTDYFLEMELEHLEKVFVEINGFPRAMVKNVIRQAVKNKDRTTDKEADPEQPLFQMVLPYRGKKGEDTMKHLQNTLNKNLVDVRTRVIYKGTRLSSCFNIKDEIAKQHKHNVVYVAQCPDCDDKYVGETGRRLQERVKEHAGGDKNSHVFKHSNEKQHQLVTINDFTILGQNYKTNFNRKVAEALFIKKEKPTLNGQIMSIPIKLFN